LKRQATELHTRKVSSGSDARNIHIEAEGAARNAIARRLRRKVLAFPRSPMPDHPIPISVISENQRSDFDLRLSG
jgi:hypothetical protein